MSGPLILPYDNDVTLTYKWANYFNIPVNLLIIRDRTPKDADIVSGSSKYIFENVNTIIETMSSKNVSFADIYAYLAKYNSLIQSNYTNIIMLVYRMEREKALNAILNVVNTNPAFNEIRNDLYGTKKNLTNDGRAKLEQLYKNNYSYWVDNEVISNVVDKLNNIEREIEPDTTPNLHNFDAVLRMYDPWINNFKNNLAIDQSRYRTIDNTQFQLQAIDRENPLYLTPVVVNSVTQAFSPTILDKNNRPRAVTVDDGLDIFDKIAVSKYIPFAKYIDGTGHPLYRLYVGDKIENEPNYNLTVIPNNESLEHNTIYLNLWLGNPDRDATYTLKNSPQEAFFIVEYDLINNHLTIKSWINANQKKHLVHDEHIAFQRVQSAFTNIDLGEGTEIKVGGNFNLYGEVNDNVINDITFDETSFVDMVLLRNIMNVYLYIEENTNAFAFKKRLDVHYRSSFSDIMESTTDITEANIVNSASVSLTIIPRITTEDTVYVVNGINRVAPRGMHYLHVNITQAESREVVGKFINIFRLLMKYYFANRAPVYEDYLHRLPQIAILSVEANQPKRTHLSEVTMGAVNTTQYAKNNDKITALKEKAGDLYIEKMATKCQKNAQPLIIDESEVEAWQNKLVFGRPRQILRFPRENSRWIFVCDSDSTPYIGVKKNDLSNRDKYPYVPCCYVKDQSNNKKYLGYLNGVIPEINTGAKASKTINTFKMLSPNRTAAIPPSIESILRQYAPDAVAMRRYGVPYGTNSLIHCICVAIDDPNYLERMKDDDALTDYVNDIRTSISGKINLLVLKQEMYDYSVEEILTLLDDNDIFLDPYIFFRALEEAYKINLYVFKSPRSGKEIDTGEIEIPRYKIFHSHLLRPERPTVIIIKINEDKVGGMSHCELIVDYDDQNHQVVKLFGESMTAICHKTLTDTLSTVTWNVNDYGNLEAHSNMYSVIDHSKIYPFHPIYQHLDLYGKLRALVYDLGNGKQMSVSTLPTVPENIPTIPDIDHLPRAVLDVVVQYLGTPSGITRNAEGLIDGLWYKLADITFAEYILVAPKLYPLLDSVELGPANPLESTGANITARIRKLKRDLNIIVQLLKWLYDIENVNRDTHIDSDVFVQKYMQKSSREIADSATFYKLGGIPRRLPQVNTVQEALDTLWPLAPTLFARNSNGVVKVVLYDIIFVDRIVKMLRDYSSLNNGLRLTPSAFLHDYYSNEDDFTVVPFSKIFLNEKDLNAWLSLNKNTKNYNQTFNIRRVVDRSLSSTLEPYIYEEASGRIYLIQNVVGGKLESALAVANIWEQNKINMGAHFPPLNVVLVHIVYGISQESTIIPLYDKTAGSDVYLKVLYYGSEGDYMANRDYYAAMLELL